MNPLRPILAVPVIALLNAVLMGLGDGAYNLIADTSPALGWSGSFKIVFWYTLIFATLAGLVLAPLMVWVGPKIPQPKFRYLLVIGLIAGPIPFLLFEGLGIDSVNGLAVFSLLGGLSSISWWHLVEKHRFVLEIENV
jgi:hypothetical protein